MNLSPRQRTALHNLSRKEAGEDVDWINIADARALTELGLAVRSREGWAITPAGQAVLKGVDPAAATPLRPVASPDRAD